MKINHETLRDNKDFGDNDFKHTTALKKESAQQIEKLPKMNMPKRKWTWFGKETMFYMVHFLAILLSLLAGGLMGHVSLFVLFVPYVVSVILAYRMGGEIKSNGANHVIWNLSVLISTYTHANTRALRARYEVLGILALVLMTIGGILSAFLLLVGFILFLLFVVFGFAEQDAEGIADKGKWMSRLLLASGILAFFLNPWLAHGTLVLSLVGNWVFEKWEDYEFSRD